MGLRAHLYNKQTENLQQKPSYSFSDLFQSQKTADIDNLAED